MDESAQRMDLEEAGGHGEAVRYQDVVCAFIVAQPGDVDEAADGAAQDGRHAPLRLLCTLRPATAEHFAGLYEFPGGKVDEGEGHVEALRRECREELGVDVVVVGHDAETMYDEGSRPGVLKASTTSQGKTKDDKTRPCYAFHHAPRPDKRLGGEVVFRLWFYWAYIAGETIDPPSTRRPQPQALASDGLFWLTPAEMTRHTFCPGDEGIIAALADGTLRPPARASNEWIQLEQAASRRVHCNILSSSI